MSLASAPSSLDLARAGPLHAAAIAVAHGASFDPRDAWSARAFAELLAMPGVSGWLAPAGGLVLLRVAADEAEILTLAVVPEARRLGLGRRLLAAAHAHAASMGARAICLEVAADNSAAQGLYASAGYKEVGRRRRYYPSGADALILKLRLQAASSPAE